jgi:N-acetylneuraminate synthase
VVAAAKAGATAVKFQTYTAETMTLDIDNFKVSDDHELWGGRRLFSLYQEAHTPWEWHSELFELCRSLNVLPFSSPFDLSAIELLESLDAPLYKIASLETSDHQLIRAVAETGKPLIISTGATEWDEIEDLVRVVEKAGNKDLTLLVCTSSYPSDPVDAHLNRMETLRNHFGAKVGLSDHTTSNYTCLGAVALGASILERHFTDSMERLGPDISSSMDPNSLRSLIEGSKIIFSARGGEKTPIAGEASTIAFAFASVVATRDIIRGERISPENIWVRRPSGGDFNVLDYESLFGKTAVNDIKGGYQLKSTDVH